MDRRLYLLRHAKSSWGNPDLADFDRPLARRGERAAAVIATYLEQARVRPDIVLCSPAVRARQSCEVVCRAFPEPCRIVYLQEIYGADGHELLAILRNVELDRRNILLIGHNPGLHMLALLLAAPPGVAGAGTRRTLLEQGLPTAGLVSLGVRLPAWSKLIPHAAEMLDFVVPKQLV